MQVGEAVKTPFGWMKSHPWIFAILILVVAVLFLRSSDTIKEKVVTEAKAGSGLYKTLANILGYSLTALAAFFLLTSDAHAAAACCSTVREHGTGFWAVLSGLGGVASLGLGYVAGFPAVQPRLISAGTGGTADSLTFATAGTGAWVYGAPAPNGRAARRASGIRLVMTFTCTQGGSGSALTADSFDRLVEKLKVEKEGIGIIADDSICTGPVLSQMTKLATTKRLYTQPTLAANNTTPTLVRVELLYPFVAVQRKRAVDTAYYVGELDGMKLEVTIKDQTFLRTLSTGVTITSPVVSMYVDEFDDQGKSPVEAHGVLIPRLIKRDATAGGNDISLLGLGQPAHPEIVNKANGVKVCEAVLLSNSHGLPGHGTFTDALELGCPGLGLDRTRAVETHARAQIAAVDNASERLGTVTDAPCQPVGSTTDAALLARLDALPLRLLSKDANITQTPKVGPQDAPVIYWRQATMPSAGSYAVLALTVADMSSAHASALLGRPVDTSKRQTAGTPRGVRKVDPTGIPQNG